MAEVRIQSERVDDIPLLIGQQEKMGIPEVVDAVIRPNGHRQGLSVGWLVVVWLSYILSEADHCMVIVEEWVSKRLHTLGHMLPGEVAAGDFTDDGLADILRYLSDGPS
jgi:transposase